VGDALPSSAFNPVIVGTSFCRPAANVWAGFSTRKRPSITGPKRTPPPPPTNFDAGSFRSSARFFAPIAVAYAKQAGQTGFSSVILGAFALGSTLAGIVFGSRMFRSTMTRRLVIAATGMFVLEVPALLVDGLWPLAVVMFVAGSATAPLLITSLSLAQRLVPKALVTEGMAVAITGVLIGISAGSAVGGWAIEAWGAQLAYAVPVVSGGLALALIAVRYRHLEEAELAGGRALEPDSTPVTA